MSLAIVALLILLATRDTPVPTSWGFRGASEAFGIVCGTVGAIVAIRRPDNIDGWLFCAMGFLFALAALINEYVIAGVLVVPGGLPLTTPLGWLLAWLWVPPLAIAVIFLPLYFPDGRLPSPSWRRVVVFSVVAVVLFAAAISVQPGPIQQATFLDNPLGLDTDMATYGSLVLGPAAVLFGTAIVLAIASLVVRFRRATDEARQQVKWFALAVLIAGATFALSLLVTLITLSATTVKALEILVIVALMGIPTAAGMAILRYRLYDIDRIVSRTIAYAVISAFLVGAYAVVILVLQGPLGRVFGGGDTISVALSTLAVAALFQPVRRWVQRVVDRRFDRARFDAERTAVAFAERLRNEVDIDAVTGDLDRTVQAAMRPSVIGLWLRDG